VYNPELDRYGNRKKIKTKEFGDFYRFQADRDNLAGTTLFSKLMKYFNMVWL